MPSRVAHDMAIAVDRLGCHLVLSGIPAVTSPVTRDMTAFSVTVTLLGHPHTLTSHSTMDMNMDPSSSTTMSDMMMIPWFHFTKGDHLLFKSWIPTTAGAIFGACVALFFLAIIDRCIAAVRATLQAHWRRRGLAMAASNPSDGGNASSPSRASVDGPLDTKYDVNNQTKSVDALPTARIVRTVPPFSLSHDLPRGLLFALQALFGYVLMLAVMTFNASYIFSIVVGLGVGEVIFGRMTNGASIH